MGPSATAEGLRGISSVCSTARKTAAAPVASTGSASAGAPAARNAARTTSPAHTRRAASNVVTADLARVPVEAVTGASGACGPCARRSATTRATIARAAGAPCTRGGNRRSPASTVPREWCRLVIADRNPPAIVVVFFDPLHGILDPLCRFCRRNAPVRRPRRGDSGPDRAVSVYSDYRVTAQTLGVHGHDDGAARRSGQRRRRAANVARRAGRKDTASAAPAGLSLARANARDVVFAAGRPRGCRCRL